MRSNITIVIEHDDNFDISVAQVSTFDTIIAIEDIVINRNIAQPYL